MRFRFWLGFGIAGIVSHHSQQKLFSHTSCWFRRAASNIPYGCGGRCHHRLLCTWNHWTQQMLQCSPRLMGQSVTYSVLWIDFWSKEVTKHSTCIYSSYHNEYETVFHQFFSQLNANQNHIVLALSLMRWDWLFARLPAITRRNRPTSFFDDHINWSYEVTICAWTSAHQPFFCIWTLYP